MFMWSWSDGSKFNYRIFNGGQPDNDGGAEFCIMMQVKKTFKTSCWIITLVVNSLCHMSVCVCVCVCVCVYLISVDVSFFNM